MPPPNNFHPSAGSLALLFEIKNYNEIAKGTVYRGSVHLSNIHWIPREFLFSNRQTLS